MFTEKLKIATSLASLVCGVYAIAAPLNTTGIPAGATGVIHADIDAAKQNRIVKEAAGSEGSAVLVAMLQEALGVTDITDVTLGILPPPNPQGEPGVVFVARGKFLPQKIFAVAKVEKNKTVPVGKYTFIQLEGGDVTQPAAAVLGPAAALVANTNFFVCPLSEKAVVGVSDIKLASAVIAALAGSARSYAAPSTVAAYGKYSGTPALVGYVNFAKLPKPAPPPPGSTPFPMPPPPSELFIALGDDGRDLKLRITVNYLTVDEAQQANALLQMGLGFAQQSLASDSNDPKKAAGAAKARKFLNALKYSVTDKRFNFAFTYSQDELLLLLKEERKKSTATIDVVK